jgi:hypothetical protein
MPSEKRPSESGRLMLTPWLSHWMSFSMSALFLTANGTLYAQFLPDSVVLTAGTGAETAITLETTKRGVKVKIGESTSIARAHRDFIKMEGFCHYLPPCWASASFKSRDYGLIDWFGKLTDDGRAGVWVIYTFPDHFPLLNKELHIILLRILYTMPKPP